MRNPTHAEKLYWTRLVETIGCIACRLDGNQNPSATIHHIDGRTKPGAHSKVLPLCAGHHQAGGEDAPAIHPWKARFIKRYGSQESLKALCDQLLDGCANENL